KIVQMIDGGSPEFWSCQRDIMKKRRRVTRQQFQYFGVLWNELHDDVVYIGHDRHQDRSRNTKRKRPAVDGTIKYFDLAGAHEHGVAFPQRDFAAARLGNDRTGLIDNEYEITIAVGEEFACARDTRRRHRGRHNLHAWQRAGEDGAV